jgi:hypothetical protein
MVVLGGNLPLDREEGNNNNGQLSQFNVAKSFGHKWKQ